MVGDYYFYGKIHKSESYHLVMGRYMLSLACEYTQEMLLKINIYINISLYYNGNRNIFLFKFILCIIPIYLMY